jgi:uncharacterized membrane protein YeaQ/YmgE (transglycosylase-associated protein family)
MTVEEIIILLVVAAVLGVVAQRMLGYKLGGFFASVVLGFLGGLLGKFMASRFPLPLNFNIEIGDTKFQVVWSVLGTLLVTFIVGFIAKGAAKEQKKKG